MVNFSHEILFLEKRFISRTCSVFQYLQFEPTCMCLWWNSIFSYIDPSAGQGANLCRALRGVKRWRKNLKKNQHTPEQWGQLCWNLRNGISKKCYFGTAYPMSKRSICFRAIAYALSYALSPKICIFQIWALNKHMLDLKYTLKHTLKHTALNKVYLKAHFKAHCFKM